jgi:hypothetical protein
MRRIVPESQTFVLDRSPVSVGLHLLGRGVLLPSFLFAGAGKDDGASQRRLRQAACPETGSFIRSFLELSHIKRNR